MRRGNWTPSLRASLSFSFSSSMLWAVIFVGLSLPVGSLAGLELQQHQESSRRWATRLELLSHQYNPALKSITPESTNIIALPTVRMQLRGGAEVDGQPGSNNFLDPESLEKFVWSPELSSSGFDPLFMTGMTEKEQEAARAEWIEQIMEAEEDQDELMEHHKEEGNKAVGHARRLKGEGNGNYTKLYAEAVNHYSDALRQNTTQVLLRALCFANRAACHLERCNFGHCIRDGHAVLRIYHAATDQDANASIRIPAHLRAAVAALDDSGRRTLFLVARKAVVRAAQASIAIEKFVDALEWCAKGEELRNSTLLSGASAEEEESMRFWSRVEGLREEARKRRCEQEAAEARNEDKRRLRAEQRRLVQETVQKGGVLLGATLYPGVLANQLVDVSLDTSVDASGKKANTLWPLMFIYEEFQQTDFLRQCPESSNIFYHLNTVLDKEAPPPPWDPQRAFTPFNVAVYLISYQTPLLVDGKAQWVVDPDTGRRMRPKWIRVDPWLTLEEILRLPGHIVPGFPVLHVVRDGSKWEQHMLARPPEEFLPSF